MKTVQDWTHPPSGGTDMLLHDFLSDRAALSPNAVAYEFEDAALSFAEANGAANEIAARLTALGAERETVVAVFCERGLELPLAIFGVLKSGAAFLYMDPDEPGPRSDQILKLAGVRVALATKALMHRVPAEVRVCEIGDPSLSRRHAEAVAADCRPSDIAQILPTSGSTGEPKLVMRSHAMLAGQLIYEQGAINYTCDDRHLMKFPVSFRETLLPALAGGCAVIVPPGVEKDPAQLTQLMHKRRISIASFVPTVLIALLNEPSIASCVDLRFVSSGGELLNNQTQSRFHEKLKARLRSTYTMTEADYVASWDCTPGHQHPNGWIGHPTNMDVFVAAEDLSEAPAGTIGEIVVGGPGLATGYLSQPAQTNARFVRDPRGGGTARLYRTGDLGRALPDGRIVYCGRADDQVKLGGRRIELGEVERALLGAAGVSDAAAAVVALGPQDDRLVCFVVAEAALRIGGLRETLSRQLPSYMVPSLIMRVETLPRLANGKLDRRSLPVLIRRRPELPNAYVAPLTRTEKLVAAVWADVLFVADVGMDDNFVDLGGNSLLAIAVHARLQKELGLEFPVSDLYSQPTVRAFAAKFDDAGASAIDVPGRSRDAPRAAVTERGGTGDAEPVAIIGLAGRFPDSPDVARFWANLLAGRDCIANLDAHAGAANRAEHILRWGVLDDAEAFDAAFFGIAPHEALAMDPQHRILLELAWNALDDAGRGAQAHRPLCGVYIAIGSNRYEAMVRATAGLSDRVGDMVIETGNAPEHAAGRICHKLNLGGPVATVQTACSSSLVALHLACAALRSRGCDMAVAGGVSIKLPQTIGYDYKEGGIASPDGRARSFDARASGTVGGNGGGLVVLRRLSDALAGGDPIRAVILGSAVNNDAARRLSYGAPSAEGQAEVIGAALAMAGAPPDTIGYVECHGSGTPLGDSIELAALARVFPRQAPASCVLSAVKSNVGHLREAAGITGLIKAVLAVSHGVIPPTLHFQCPVPQLADNQSPFVVATEPRPWPGAAAVRRAGVSAFGLGGTNAHIVLEQAPVRAERPAARPWQVLTLSARDEAALDAQTRALAEMADKPDAPELRDLAHTLQTGREAMNHRRIVLCRDATELPVALGAPAMFVNRGVATPARVAFLIAGTGDGYLGLGHGLYCSEPAFRKGFDRCLDMTKQLFARDLRNVILHPRAPIGQFIGAIGGAVPRGEQQFADLAEAHCAHFTVTYALASLWRSMGVEPAAIFGYSLGEYVAAALAGVLSLEDALKLVVERARLIGRFDTGAMLAVCQKPDEIRAILRDNVQIAAFNGPTITVLAGPEESIDALEANFAADNVITRRLPTRHALHTSLMDPARAALSSLAQALPHRTPQTQLVQGLTAGTLEAGQTPDSSYWAEHLCRPVQFTEAIRRLLSDGCTFFIEIGAGMNLISSVSQMARSKAVRTVASLPALHDARSDRETFLGALGRYWVSGGTVDWSRAGAADEPRRVSAPGYAFDRKVFSLHPEPEEQSGRPPANSVATVAPPLNGSTKDAAGQSNLQVGGALESRIIEMFKDITGVETVDRTSSFFEIGGHSLFGLQLLNRLREVSARPLNMKTLYDLPTPAQLTEFITEGESCPESATSCGGPQSLT